MKSPKARRISAGKKTKPPVGKPRTTPSHDQDDDAPEPKRGPGRPREPANDRLREANLRKALLDVEIREVELARIRGQVLSVEQFRTALANAFSRVSAKLNGLEQRIAMQVTGATLQERLQQASPLVLELKRDLSAARDVPLPAGPSKSVGTLRKRHL